MNPQNAKWNFKFRMLVNFAYVLAVFVPVVVVASFLNGGAIIIMISIGVAYFVFFHVLADRAIAIKCPNCSKTLMTNTPWVCGFCQHKNTRANEFPFIHRCEPSGGCGADIKTYKCHHTGCEKLIFLTEDHQEENYAYAYREVTPVPDKAKEEINKQQKDKRDLEHQLMMTRLTAELNEAKRTVDPPKEKAPHEIVEESFSRYNTFTMSAYDIARREKAANAEKYKDDPEMLERANLSVDTWLRDRT
jgi:hypothetical protein